ncbi:MAG TPA: four helix bundle protein [Flavisolibacter sp.]|jgi:four helix bundle protein|nr:four helix bundle protein [Flavisolibacter sp.]
MDVIKLEDIDIYLLALEIDEDVWKVGQAWDRFSKRTVGEQFVEAADSTSANIAEGYGRYFYKDRKTFCYYSRGSLMGTKNWAAKSLQRSLPTPSEYDILSGKLQGLHYRLNLYIKKLKANSLL